MRSFLDRLFEPSARVTDRAQRRQARLLARLSLAHMVIALQSVIYTRFFDHGLTSAAVPLVLGPGVAVIGLAYALSRAGDLRRAVPIYVGVTLLIPIVILLRLRGAPAESPLVSVVWLLLPILVTSVFGTARSTAAVTGIAMVTLAAIVPVLPQSWETRMHFGILFLFSYSVLTLVVTAHRDRLEQARALELRERNRELEVLRASLEQRVDERTVQLRDANEQLRREMAERLEVEKELRQIHKLEAVGRLAAGIAHELNTPIQFANDSCAYVGEAFAERQRLYDLARDALFRICAGTVAPADALAELQRAEATGDDAYRRTEGPQAIAQALEGLQRVATIVNSMKEFSHPGEATKVNADVNRGILATLAVARNEYKYIADVRTDLAPLPPVACHIGELNQAVLAIVVNAAHAIEDAVRGTQRRGEISITSRLEGGSVWIAISDTGVGIPAEVREKIFDPFFTTKEVGRGTGQGLAIARSIVVDKHGGDLQVESTVGVGTTFTIRIPVGTSAEMPVASPPVVATRARASVMSAAAGLPRVLVTDDEVIVAKVVQRALRGRCKVEVATDGHQALALVRAGNEYDLILCDASMPGLGGLDLLEILRREAPHVVGRFVFVTGGARNQVDESRLAAAGVPILFKPFNRTDLLELIDRYVAAPEPLEASRHAS